MLSWLERGGKHLAEYLSRRFHLEPAIREESIWGWRWKCERLTENIHKKPRPSKPQLKRKSTVTFHSRGRKCWFKSSKVWKGVTTTTAAADSYWASDYCVPVCSKPWTRIISPHLFITNTPWSWFFCYPHFTFEGTKVLGAGCAQGHWLVAEPRCELGQSSPRGFFYLPCSWYRSGKSLTESHFQGTRKAVSGAH